MVLTWQWGLVCAGMVFIIAWLIFEIVEVSIKSRKLKKPFVKYSEVNKPGCFKGRK
jgi:hypothetical protein